MTEPTPPSGERDLPPARLMPVDYPVLLRDIKERIRRARARAIMAVNAELNALYWEIGAMIADRQRQEGWGSGVITRLARDLRNEFPRRSASPRETSTGCWPSTASTPTSTFRHKLWRGPRKPSPLPGVEGIQAPLTWT